ncbi:MAG TPA: stage III sporulation protein AF [Candidatus Pullilachnospira intestinigallinarum]|nr:stage III sporulation protein AF [Candidatus Pullilachnospira intestinigallinarum]
MEWVGEWIRNLAFYFIFLSAVMNFLPGGEEKKYIRFFMGMLLILLVLRPVLSFRGAGDFLENSVLAESVSQDYREMLREGESMELLGETYVKDACERELAGQVRHLAEGLGYCVLQCQAEFFGGEELELKEIRLTLENAESAPQDNGEAIKNQLMEVYNIPEGNINISIQG